MGVSVYERESEELQRRDMYLNRKRERERE